MTLIRSNTTRRSAPMIRSRLRRPTSKSTITTVWPDCASAAPIEADEVVLPTPPLPEVTTSTCACAIVTPYWTASVEGRDEHQIAFEPGLYGLAAQSRFDIVSSSVETADGEQFGFDLAAKDAGPFIA